MAYIRHYGEHQGNTLAPHFKGEVWISPNIYLKLMDAITQNINLARAMGMFRVFKMIEEDSHFSCR